MNNNTNKETRMMLKQNNYLFTVQDILGALSKAEGFKSRNSKNFARVLASMQKGIGLLDILANPSLANVPANQVRYFEQFVQDNKLSKRLYTPTRKGVLVPVADIDNMIVRDGKVVSTIDYSEVNAQTHKEISESFMSETFASAPETIEFSQDGEVYKTRLMLP